MVVIEFTRFNVEDSIIEVDIKLSIETYPFANKQLSFEKFHHIFDKAEPLTLHSTGFDSFVNHLSEGF